MSLSHERSEGRSHLHLHLPSFHLQPKRHRESNAVPLRARLRRLIPSPRIALHPTFRLHRYSHRPEKRRGMSAAGRRFWQLIAHGTQPGAPHGLLLAWARWEEIAHRLWPLREIPAAPFGLLQIYPMTYDGDPVVLRDGTEVRPGAALYELHCNNQRAFALTSAGKNPYRAVREDLRALAQWAMDSKDGRSVCAFYGFSMLGSVAARLGFSVRECPHSLRLHLERMFMRGLLLMYTPEGLSRLHNGTSINEYPYEVWISRKRLIRLYGPGASVSREERRGVTLRAV